MSEIQIDERTAKVLAVSHYEEILVKTKLLLQYAEFEGLSVMEAIRDVMKKIKTLKAELETEQK